MISTVGKARSSRDLAYWKQVKIGQLENGENGKKDTHRSGEVGTGNALNGGIQVVERLRLDDLGTDLGSHTESGEATLNGHETAARQKHWSAPAPRSPASSKSRTHRLVFLTLSLIVSISNGLMLLMLTTSTWMPSFSRISAASRLSPTMRECATTVTSVPTRSILALPMGRRKSVDWASLETAKDWP